MRLLLLILIVGLAGCASSSHSDRNAELYGLRLDSQDRGTLLFSIRIFHRAEAPPEKNLSGNFYYVDRSGRFNSPPRPIVVGYRVEDGRLKDVIGIWNYDEMATKIRAIGFENFDLDAEIKAIEERTQTTFEAFHGLDSEITFMFDGQRFVSRRWRIGTWIDEFAPQSPKIAKLKAVIDVFATYHGRQMLPL